MNAAMRANARAQRRWSSLPESAAAELSNNRVKGKSRWKLKFHHQQALPTEHQHQHHRMAKLQLGAKLRTPATPLSVAGAPSPSPSPLLPFSRCAKSRRVAVAANATGISTVAVRREVSSTPATAASRPSSLDSRPWSPQSTVRYGDLPYMGEMTLDNAVPRRGRKPKKADICHLIYKNYGVTVVDEPLNLCLRDVQLDNDEPMTTRVAVDGDARCTRDDDDDDDVSIRKFEFIGDATSALRQKRRVVAAGTVDGPSKPVARLLERKSRLLGRQLVRRNRKSLARERLERTFQERGFLIQTQHLESAQGATYCKFRQLRKFTRYLFRSWKQHLPGDVADK